jgi:hypothetical protein
VVIISGGRRITRLVERTEMCVGEEKDGAGPQVIREKKVKHQLMGPIYQNKSRGLVVGSVVRVDGRSQGSRK